MIYIALLRGINVGGHNLIKMQDLKGLFTNLGLKNVKTYIQSGNVVFQSEENEQQLRQKIEEEIRTIYGYNVPVIIRTGLQWEQILSHCPYRDYLVDEGESVHISFMENEPSQEGINHLLTHKTEMEDIHILGTEIYLLLRQSFHTSKMTAQLHKLGLQATIRNWKTIQKINTIVNEMI